MSFREFDFPPRRSFRLYLYLQFTIGARGNTILARSSLGFCTHDYAPGARAPAEAPARAHTTVAFGNPGILWPWFEWIYVSDHLITHLHTILARRPVWTTGPIGDVVRAPSRQLECCYSEVYLASVGRGL